MVAAKAPLAPTVTQISVAGSARKPLSRSSLRAMASRSCGIPSANEYVLRPSRMAAMAPSRTSGGVGRSQIPWPRLMPLTRSHSRVMRRMSDWTRPSSLRAILMGSGSTIRRRRLLGRSPGHPQQPTEDCPAPEERYDDEHGAAGLLLGRVEFREDEEGEARQQEDHGGGKGEGQRPGPRAGEGTLGERDPQDRAAHSSKRRADGRARESRPVADVSGGR